MHTPSYTEFRLSTRWQAAMHVRYIEVLTTLMKKYVEAQLNLNDQVQVM
jgi:hypothetical protein